MKVLRRRQFGDLILRQKAHKLTKSEINSKKIQQLIADMRHTLKTKKYGVGLAAPQIGHSLALSIIEIKPTKLRPKLPKSQWASLVIINPEITKTYGQRKQLYEGCISFAEVFAKVPRYKKVRVRYSDDTGKRHQKDFEGLLAHVLQHEIDHLSGILFVDKVKDPKTYITLAQYKRIIKTRK